MRPLQVGARMTFDLGDAAGHVAEDDVLRPGNEVGRPHSRSERISTHHGRHREQPEAIRESAKHLPPRHGHAITEYR